LPSVATGDTEMHPCEKCGEPIQDQYRLCYVCMLDDRKAMQEAQKRAYSAQTPSNPTYTAPTANIAPNAKETAIAKAHEENMEANRQLIAAIVYLADAIKGGKA